MTIRPQLREIDDRAWADGKFVDELSAWTPTVQDDFLVRVSTQIGVEGEAGADIFTICACSGGRARRLTRSEWSRRPIVLYEWRLDLLERKLRELCAAAEDADWESAAKRLCEYCEWEFEDYRP